MRSAALLSLRTAALLPLYIVLPLSCPYLRHYLGRITLILSELIINEELRRSRYNLSTKAKLLLGFIVVIALNIIVALVAITSMAQVQQAASTIDGVVNISMRRAINMQNALIDGDEKWMAGLNTNDHTNDLT